MPLIYRVRDALRKNPLIVKSVLLAQSVRASLRGRLVAFQHEQAKTPRGKGVAICLRFRDEAPFLAEFLEYHRAAGVDHFFLYDNNSSDGYESVVAPFVASGLVTLIPWPRTPASPAAEEDCIRLTLGHYEWVGFVDADEFLVIRDGRSIGEFLADFPTAPAVVVHWRFFGSSGHDRRPDAPVIVAYTECERGFNTHVKTFLRPERAAECRNSHSWFYTPWELAVNELGQKSLGSIPSPASGEKIYLNHYYCKSREDYTGKMNRKSTLDAVGINYPSRTQEKIDNEMLKFRDVKDDSAVRYYKQRCELLGEQPALLHSGSMIGTDQ